MLKDEDIEHLERVETVALRSSGSARAKATAFVPPSRKTICPSFTIATAALAIAHLSATETLRRVERSASAWDAGRAPP